MGWVASFLRRRSRPNLGKNGIESWLGKKLRGAEIPIMLCIWEHMGVQQALPWDLLVSYNKLTFSYCFILFLYTSILRRPWAPFCSMKRQPDCPLEHIIPKVFSQREGHPPPVLGKSLCAFQHSHQLKWAIYPERPVGTSKIIGMPWHGMTCSSKQWKESNTFSLSIMICYFEDRVMIPGLSGLS